MPVLVAPLEKAVAAKDYGKLIPKKGVDALGRNITHWVLPEDAKQQGLFEGEDEGKGNEAGGRGYHDHLDRGTEAHMIQPLVKILSGLDPDMARRMQFKYENYGFDRDTKEKDIEVDYAAAWYMRKIKQDPLHREEYQEEYNKKTDKIVRQINNRKAAMLKIKKGQRVLFNGQPAVLADFTERGYPIVRTADGDKKAFWEELK